MKNYIYIFLLLSSIIFAEGPIPTPEISLDPTSTSITEGNSGTKTTTIKVKIDQCPTRYDIKIKYYTEDSSATTSDNDYNSKSGEIVFKVDNCSKEFLINIDINGDAKEESDELFYLKITDNGTSDSQPYNIESSSSSITIINDDSTPVNENDIDLKIEKSTSDKRPQEGEEFRYTIKVSYNSDYSGKDKVKVVDDIPSDLTITRLDDKGDFYCSISGNRVTCKSRKNIDSYEYTPYFYIYVKANVAYKDIKNEAYVYPENLNEINWVDNRDSTSIYTIAEGEEDEVEIEKSILNPKPIYNVGDIVTFKITVTNIGFSKRIAMRDRFPKVNDSWGTTHDAFEFVDYTKPDDVTCEYVYPDTDYTYIYCYTDDKYVDKQSFTINLRAKILKRGTLCNRAHAYEYPAIWKAYSDVCLNAIGNGEPYLHKHKNIDDIVEYIGSSISLDLNDYFIDPEGDKLTYSAINLPESLSLNSITGEISGTLTEIGTYDVTVTATDTYGASASTTFSITIKATEFNANDDYYNTPINTKITDNVLKNDEGTQLTVTGHSEPSNGTLTIEEDGDFTYNPNYNYIGEDIFYYDVKDISGKTAKVKVTINVDTNYHASYTKFEIVNPEDTQNILGNYIIIGNTISCVTNSAVKFDSECLDNKIYNNNNYMVKYIDIDSNDKTWNSSSSNFILPDTFSEDDNNSILWAGLFWQGSINNFISPNSIQRRAYLSNDNIKYQNITPLSGNIDFKNAKADEVLLKIDNEESYHLLKASELYYDETFGTKGGYYASYVTITDLLQNANLKKGEHTITVANITSNEGREVQIGNYAGWSLVIIYKEKGFNAKPRNISVYGGYLALGESNKEANVDISGFKLPKYGTVNSELSFFSGEGDYLYGSKSTDYDKVVIKKSADSTGYLMPGAIDPTNIFNSMLANIDRENISNNNLLNNNNGIDVDSYDVSSIMTKFRDEDPEIKSVNLGIEVDAAKPEEVDYITPSMISFSTELYAPKLCYDYSVKIGENYNVNAPDRTLNITNFLNKPLQIKVMIRSQEADFDIHNSKLYITFNPSDAFKYNSAQVSVSNSYSYENVTAIDSTKGVIPIGKDLTSNGGVISAKETIYSKLYYDFIKPEFKGDFDINLEGEISFDGTNYVHYQFNTAAPEGSSSYIERCPINPVYSPLYGQFNIERGDSTFSQEEAARYSLKTQVVGVPYEISIAHYTRDSNGEYTKEENSDATVELDLIDGGTFENNSSAGYDSICQDPDTFAKGVFVKFNNNSRVKLNIPNDYPDYPKDLALKSAIYRVWLLTKSDVNSTDRVLVNHNCSSQSDSKCFDDLYKDIYQNGDDKDRQECLSHCTNSSGSSCYDCLRKYYSLPLCSRDNFSIRPDSFYIQISDDNETKSTNRLDISNNIGTTNANIAAGYLYRLDINATKYNTQSYAQGYYFSASGDNGTRKALATFADSTNCIDKNNQDIKVTLINGSTHTYDNKDNNNTTPYDNGYYATNSGKYILHIEDSEWTAVDQKNNPLKPFKEIEDCIIDSTTPNAGELNGLRGCSIKSNSGIYNDLAITSHPYSFDISTITLQTTPNSAQDKYIYINDLNSTIDKVKDGSVMGINISGSIIAKGKDGTNLSNYINGCSAKDIDIDLKYQTDPTIVKDEKGNIVEINYLLYTDTITSNITIDKTTTSPIKYNFNQIYFATPATGTFNSYINFKRHYNAAINPFNVEISDINVSSISDKISVDLKSDFIPKGYKDLNSSRVFYYAKAKSSNDFYDDVYDNKISTPIEVSIFCNKSLEDCQKYGIDTIKSITNEYDWWLSLDHNAAALEGEVELLTNSLDATVKPTLINNFVKGIDNNVTVEYKSSALRPAIIKIMPTTNMISNYPWILYNASDDLPPKYIYRVRFVDSPASWSGEGKTGYTINTNSNGRKTKKVDW